MSKIQLDEVLEGDDLRLLLQEKLILDVTSKICELMEDQGISKADLSRALKTSKGYVTQMLDGSRNLTLRTLSDVFLALNKQVCIRASDVNSFGRPVELHLAQEPTWNKSKRPWFADEDAEVVVNCDDKNVA